MKSKSTIYLFIFSLLIILLTANCTKKDPAVEVPLINNKNISGRVQKGPFVNGTTILASELNNTLGQTGKVFTSQILDNAGSFEITDINLESSFVEFYANGYYFDEVAGEKSVSPLGIYAISDISGITVVNLNVLTHLERLRVKYLVEHGSDLVEAKKKAQGEIMAIFGFSPDNMAISESLDISVNTESNAILLAISVILQGNLSIGDLTELLANISTDIREDGVLNSEAIMTTLRNSAKGLKLETIRSNIEKRYADLGVLASIPDFEKYVNEFLTFTAKEPVSTLLETTNITTTTATVNGIVNPGSLSTSVIFEYDKNTAYGKTATAIQSPLSGSLDVNVNANITNLLPGTTYLVRLKTENSLGKVYSDILTFTTLGLLPEPATLPATDISGQSAVLNGIVNPEYLSTVVEFEYGQNTNYGNNITAVQSPVTGGDPVNASAAISGLAVGQTYHFRLKAENSIGISYSEDMTFTTSYNGMVGVVTDIEGGEYPTIGIGNQVWMAENLRMSTLNDGTPITEVNDSMVWVNNNTALVCSYLFNISYKKYTGALYNWEAINTGKLCPVGWHVPSYSEWTELSDFLGGSDIAGGKLKQVGSDWNSPNTGATNESGFSALPGGRISADGWFEGQGYSGYWWTSTQKSTNTAWVLELVYGSSSLYPYAYEEKKNGYSVRCVRDE